MAAEASQPPLAKVDSKVGVEKISLAAKRRASSMVSGVWSIQDLEADGKELQIAIETQKLNWRLNKSPKKLEEPEHGYLKKPLTTPPVKKITLKFTSGLDVVANNMKGVTIGDALEAIHKQFRKKADDELDEPVLAGFEWDKDESWSQLKVHCKKEGAPQPKKKGKKAAADVEE